MVLQSASGIWAVGCFMCQAHGLVGLTIAFGVPSWAGFVCLECVSCCQLCTLFLQSGEHYKGNFTA